MSDDKMSHGDDDPTVGGTRVPDLTSPRKRKKKRIKRRKGGKGRYYFNENTQRAIELYQTSNDQGEREKLYAEKIYPAFEQLVEKLICIYKFSGLYDSHEDLKSDCITFLYQTLHKFDPSRGTKAFSYFNVVARNWLIVRSKKRQQTVQKMVSLDARDAYDREGYSHISSGGSPGMSGGGTRLIDQLAEELTTPGQDEKMMLIERSRRLKGLLSEIRAKLTNENELKCIDSIASLFEMSDELPMLNKRAVFTYIREMSGLSRKQLTLAISTIKRHYNELKMDDDLGIF